MIGVVIVMVSALCSIYFVKRHTIEQSKAVKAVLFGLYFWGLVFLQLIISALVYVLMDNRGV